MAIVKKLIRLVSLASLIVFVILLIYKPPFPNNSEIDKRLIEKDPIQDKVQMDKIELYAGDLRYEIQPEYSYDLWGLVVSQHDSKSFLDIYHKKDPANTHDVCVVWGKNIANGSFREVKYRSGDYVCIYSWSSKHTPDISGLFLSNNHLVPSNSGLAYLIASTNIGDQIHIKGYLSKYKIYDNKGNLKLTRGTSTRRDDTGNGACETIYVTDYEIIKRSKAIMFNQIKNVSEYILISSFFLNIILLMYF